MLPNLHVSLCAAMPGCSSCLAVSYPGFREDNLKSCLWPDGADAESSCQPRWGAGLTQANSQERDNPSTPHAKVTLQWRSLPPSSNSSHLIVRVAIHIGRSPQTIVSQVFPLKMAMSYQAWRSECYLCPLEHELHQRRPTFNVWDENVRFPGQAIYSCYLSEGDNLSALLCCFRKFMVRDAMWPPDNESPLSTLGPWRKPPKNKPKLRSCEDWTMETSAFRFNEGRVSENYW